MRLLVKIGGTLLDDAESRRRLAQEIAVLHSSGVRVAVVHGGGKQMTRYLERQGIESRFLNGFRITTPETLEALLCVLAGAVNTELVAAFLAAGVRAVGLTGVDAGLVEAEPLGEAWGAVGRPVGARGDLLHLLLGQGYLPVVACVAGDGRGGIYNVNADQMAVACARACAADRLVFLTDVPGVLGRDQNVLAQLGVAQCEELVRSGVATGGMQAKLAAAVEALRDGVGEVVIAPGAEARVLHRLLAGDKVGTRLLAAEVAG
ncbi:MAG: acetylglutamate kinase [Bryobacterales bacterium]|nr:acetylglutamate kinase [Bryobacteraceae bacterium]MDW8355451.1 acetylglutamate kinase [Bryobacterales bacterium]